MRKSHYHCIYRITYHLVLVTKGKVDCLNKPMTERLEFLIRGMCEKSDLQVVQINSDSQHIHIHIEAHPNIMPSKFVNSLKTVTSRYIRQEFDSELSSLECKSGLWARGYGLFTPDVDIESLISDYVKTASTT